METVCGSLLYPRCYMHLWWCFLAPPVTNMWHCEIQQSYQGNGWNDQNIFESFYLMKKSYWNWNCGHWPQALIFTQHGHVSLRHRWTESVEDDIPSWKLNQPQEKAIPPPARSNKFGTLCKNIIIKESTKHIFMNFMICLFLQSPSTLSQPNFFNELSMSPERNSLDLIIQTEKSLAVTTW